MRKTKTRRGRGEGSIYFRESDGRWVGSVVVGYSAETGRPLRRNVYGATKEEALEKLDALRGKVKAGAADGDKLPFRNAIDFWLAGQVKPHADEATYRLYQQRIRDHILPHLGHIAVAALNPYLIQNWGEELERQGCTPNLRKNCSKLLRRCLDQCVEFGFIRSNPARKLRLPRAHAHEIRPLDADQVKRFLAVAEGHRLAALWLLALDSGMRQGEMLALEWSDVDFDAGVVSVTKSIRTEKGGATRVKEVKTKAGRRRIRLTRRTLEALAERRQRSEGRLVFGTPGRGRRRGEERYLRKNAVLATFRRLLAKAGLPTVRFHDLRHTHATLALAATKNIKAVSSRLGHGDITVTLNVYAHYLPAHEDEYVTAMEKMLQRPPQDVNGSSQYATVMLHSGGNDQGLSASKEAASPCIL
jgi:integrase